MSKKERWGWWVAAMVVGVIGFAVIPEGGFWREVGAAVLFGIAYDLRLKSGAKSLFNEDPE